MANAPEEKAEDGEKSAKGGGIHENRLFSGPWDFKRWVCMLGDTYNWRLLWMLVASQMTLKGFVMGYALGGFDWLLSARNVPGPKMQIYSAVGMLPFAMKPLVGMLSDAFPIMGYQKIPYLLVATVIGVAGLLTITMSGFVNMPVQMLVLGLFCIIMMVSSADLLTEAKYAERIRAFPEKGPDLITFVWLLVTCGGFCATLSLGTVLEHFKPHWVYAICLIPAVVILLPTLLNFLDEKKMSPEKVVEVRAHYFAQGELVVLVVLVGLSSVCMMCSGLLQDSVWVNLAVGLTCGAVVMSSFLLLLTPMIGKMVAFGIIQHLCAFSTQGAVFYFYTNGREQYPEGPNFSPLFYMSVIGIVGSIFSLMGFSLFNLCMKHWRYHSVFFTTNIIFSIGTATSAIQFSRMNLRWGISDEVFAISYAVITSLTLSMLFLPGIVLLTQLCPKQVEATMYALLAGTSNLGTQIGGTVGAAVLTLLGVTPRGQPNESDKFDNLWIAALISSLAPMFTLVLLPWMIPNALQTERLLSEDATAVDGSPLRRWRAWRSGAPLLERTEDQGYGATAATGRAS